MSKHDDCEIMCISCNFKGVRSVPKKIAKVGMVLPTWCNGCGKARYGVIVKNLRKDKDKERIIFT